ncbi:FecR family protein [Dyadobacter sp. MSC1_007]|jgi:transmembrane sensor|uniref:FecR family protein n=1 Tax=Dyadobacter sp. MSC1_007 TaxID=2909264 RepID=UPI0020302434|nr:FecR family protein [Dyadobacter sp. MSC1_007]
MDQPNHYHIDFFLADDDFVAWAHSGKPVEGTRWEAMVNADPAVRAELEQAKMLVLEWKYVPSQLSDEKLSDGIQRIMTSVNGRNEATTPIRNAFGIWYKIAAVLLLTVGIGWLISRQNKGAKEYTYEKLTAEAGPELVEISNDRDADYKVKLPDGSEITLSKGSRISYSRHLTTDSTRDVYLKGDGFFQVMKDSKHPFLVYTGGLVTRVVGTSFKISSSGTNVSVAVKTGKVAVYLMQELEDGDKENLLLTPNQKAEYLGEQNLISKKLVENPVVLKGQEEILNFDYVDAPASGIFDSLEKAYGINITYDAEAFSNCNITIPFREEPFFTKLDIICRTIEAKYEIVGNDVIISGKGCN